MDKLTKLIWYIVGVVAIVIVISVFIHILVRIALVIGVVVVLWLVGRHLMTRNKAKGPS